MIGLATRHVPWRRIGPTTFQCTGWHSNHLARHNQFLDIEPFCKKPHLVMVFSIFFLTCYWILITIIPYAFSIGVHKWDCVLLTFCMQSSCGPGYFSLNFLKLFDVWKLWSLWVHINNCFIFFCNFSLCYISLFATCNEFCSDFYPIRKQDCNPCFFYIFISWYNFVYPFIFNLSESLGFTYVFCIQHTIEFCCCYLFLVNLFIKWMFTKKVFEKCSSKNIPWIFFLHIYNSLCIASTFGSCFSWV